jgi:glycosyltransferase involved in cell wall biosynthesis
LPVNEPATVLSVYNAYLNRGGEDEVVDSEADLLEAYGHRIYRHRVEADVLRDPGAMAKLKLAVGTVWSRHHYRRVRELIDEIRPDIVHVHNFFPLLSPSIHRASHDAGIPVVQTLHNYRLICPNALLLRDNSPCEDCIGKVLPWPGIIHACYRGSTLQSSVSATMLATHRVRNTWVRDVDLFIALTEFARRKHVEGGIAAERIVVKPNFIAPDPGFGHAEGKGFVMVGRLVAQKGLPVALQAWEEFHAPGSLTIIGDGDLVGLVQRAAADSTAIEYLGLLPRAAVLDRIRSAAALIFPSLSYETFGMTTVEAFACGRPVIASAHGSAAELVDDGRTGLLFRPGDAADLAAKVVWAESHPAEMRQMGEAARSEFELHFTGEANYEALSAIYERVLAQARRRQP